MEIQTIDDVKKLSIEDINEYWPQVQEILKGAKL